MIDATQSIITDLVREAAHPLTGSANDYDSLLKLIGDARFVLLGEASHGTHEFYRERARITQRLIREKGFNAIAVEGDWPDAYRVNRYVQGDNVDPDAVQALSGFKRFPAWMWRNADILDFVGWLRTFNDALDLPNRIGFYGLDLYSLHASMECVLRYLDRTDPDAAHRARLRYACFDNFGDDPQTYGYAAGLGIRPSCEAEAVSQLVDLHRSALRYARMDGLAALERFFDAEQNARVVKDAEEYYRTMFHESVSSWNLRDQHMVQTLDTLIEYLEVRKRASKIVIWAHNSHVGDARATQMGRAGEWNIGQLIRQKYSVACLNIGFTTYSGTVTAASEWDGSAERKQVRPARADSYEGLFHQVGVPAFLLNLKEDSHVFNGLRKPMLERAIGVVYLPASELASHYFHARLSDQFDAIIHFDQTRAVEPLEPIGTGAFGEPAETFPSGI
ncbi:erythromycin esterase family protein [Edaphobacter paludis]|uniref:Erythromycin esterase family protein n=1 Tax=Edaphobacter paludis TaxID=3035702 RepID=A0AAU7CTR7_9BACT